MNSSNNIAVTVVVATLREDAQFDLTVNSCLEQIGISIEVVAFICDKRYELTCPKIDRYEANGKCVMLMRGSDAGIADAWNVAVQKATGEYVCFLGAGDYFFGSGALAGLFENGLSDLNSISMDQKKQKVFFGKQFIRMPTDVLHAWPQRGDPNKGGLLEGMVIPHASSLWPRVLWSNEGFDQTFRIALDYEFTLRVSRKVNFIYIDHPVAVIEPGGLSNAPSRMLQVISEDVRARRINGFPSHLWSMLTMKRVLRWILSR